MAILIGQMRLCSSIKINPGVGGDVSEFSSAVDGRFLKDSADRAQIVFNSGFPERDNLSTDAGVRTNVSMIVRIMSLVSDRIRTDRPGL